MARHGTRLGRERSLRGQELNPGLLLPPVSPPPLPSPLKTPNVDNYWVRVGSLKGPYLMSNHLLTVEF